MLQCKIYGRGRRQIVADRFWNITNIENGDSLLGAEDSGECEPASFIRVCVLFSRAVFEDGEDDFSTLRPNGDYLHNNSSKEKCKFDCISSSCLFYYLTMVGSIFKITGRSHDLKSYHR